jgi:glycosyltransferase involved in cell wall biosynthesis
MRVLMFGWEFPPYISGGLGTACFGLSQGLLQKGVEILFVVPKLFGGENGKEIRLIDASKIKMPSKSLQQHYKEFTYMEIKSLLVPYVSPENYLLSVKSKEAISREENDFGHRFIFSGHYGKNLFEEVGRYAMIAAQIAKEEKFDVIHAHDWLTYLAGITAKAESAKPLIIHVHATEYDRSGENINSFVYEIEKKGMLAADRIITVSNYTRDIVINKYGIEASKVITIYNGITPKVKCVPTEWKKTLKEKVVTFLGRITFQKGPEYFIEAAKKVLDKYSQVRFVMAGSGDMTNRMIKKAAELRISSRFHFTGFLKGDEVDRMLAMTDVFVMPSVSEPFGIAPLEALQANVPVIISRQSGVSEVLHHAVKVDFWDIDALANAIYGLLKYSKLSQNFSRNGKNEIENLTWENSAEKIKQLYQYI